MSFFEIDSNYLENITEAANTFHIFKDQRFSIVINDTFRIDIPFVVATSISKSVLRLLETDQTSTEIKIHIKERYGMEESLNKIKRVLQFHEKVSLESIEEKHIFAEFGCKIGNRDFQKPLNESLNRYGDILNDDNVIKILEIKQTFGNMNIKKEIDFIAQNLENMCAKEEFFNFANNEYNIDLLENILSSNNVRLKKEDTLLVFLLALTKSNKNNQSFFRLFDYVFLEYCSAENSKELLKLIIENTETQNMKSLISCIGRRIIQPNIPMIPNFVEGRHTEYIINNENDDPLFGILHREHKKENVIMEASSTYRGNVYNLIDNDETTQFMTNNVYNSFLTATLKDRKTFIAHKYSIRGNRSKDHQINSWKLEGRSESNGEWILLDSHSNEHFGQLQVKEFEVLPHEKINAIKLTQVGQNSTGYYYLDIDSFDIFGSLFE